MKREVLKIPNSNGELLRAYLELPANKQVKQYAIFAHCFTCTSNLNVVKNVSMELTNYGFGVVRFDFTGLGRSEGEFADTNFSHNVEDLRLVNNYMIKHYEAPTLIVGHSLGGAASIIAAATIENIKAVVTIGAPADPKHLSHLLKGGLSEIKAQGEAEVNIGGRPFRIKEQFVDDLDNHSLENHLKKMRKAILILHSPQDNIVEIENAAILYKAAHHPKSFVSLDGADHLLSLKADSLYAARTIGTWAERYLLNAYDEENHTLSTNGEQVVAHLKLSNNFTTQVSDGIHNVIADEPVEVGGDDLGFSPYELLNAALGACTNMTLKLYAERKKWPLEEVYTYLSYSKKHIEDSSGDSEKLGKIDHISKKIELIGPLSKEQKDRLVEIAAKCPVHKTLTQSMVINTYLDEKI